MLHRDRVCLKVHLDRSITHAEGFVMVRAGIAVFMLAVTLISGCLPATAVTPEITGSPAANELAVFDGLIAEELMPRPGESAVADDGTIWIMDQDNDQIFILDASGNSLDTFGETGEGPGQFAFGNFGAIDIAADGSVYVLDTANERVQKFAAALSFVLEWGSRGLGPGQFISPSDIIATDDGRVYVVDNENHRVQQFDADGQFVREIRPSGMSTEFFEAVRLAIDRDGNLYVPDAGRVYVFGANGDLLRTITSYESGNGSVGVGNGVAVADDGTVYIADIVNERIAVFDNAGLFVGYFGDPGTGPGEFSEIDALTYHPDGRLFVLDFGNERVQSFRLVGHDSARPVATPAG
jgi:DNA-binding beta-propeller fold protein YncE